MTNRTTQRDEKHEAKRPEFKVKMKHPPNWEASTYDPTASEIDDRLHISPDKVPEGMDMIWCTDTVLGEPQTQHRSDREKHGWTPVHGEDFEGQFDGMFMPKGHEGEITKTGLVLMSRPMSLSIASKAEDIRAAQKKTDDIAFSLKEGKMRGITMGGADHQSALSYNKINTSYERIQIEGDK